MMRWMSAIALCAVPLALSGQTPAPPDTTKPYILAPTTVTVTRSERPLSQIPNSIQTVDRRAISQAKPTWGLDEALVTVPGVFVANRYNFSQDQRISIRGFGARSAFAVRGIKILVDGIPQTLPDGQGQLTNLELGEVDRIEVLRGSTSSLFGNASGGVISVWTNPHEAARVSENARMVAGNFSQNSARTWSKWQSTTGVRVGAEGGAQLTLSRLDYDGERDHSAADQRIVNARLNVPVGGGGWSLAVLAAGANNPQADNPGSLTFNELMTNRDTVPVLNKNRDAGKDVTQFQTGVTLRRSASNGSAAAFTIFGLTRDLKNPITTAYIDLDRVDYGARASLTYPLPLGSLAHRLTFGFDVQRQQDDRKNFAYLNTPGDSAKPDTTRTLDQLEHVTEVGPFVQSALDLSPTVALTTGVRYDWVKFTVDDRLITGTNPDDSGDRLMQALSGSLGIAVNPSRALTLYGNVASSFETPTTTELANSPSGAGGFNTGLKPQKAVNFELGTRGTVGTRFAYTAALFQANVRDALVPYEIAAPRFYYRNAGSTRHRGVELNGSVNVVTGLSVNLIWTYSNYRYREYAFTDSLGTHILNGRELPGIPKNWFHTIVRLQPSASRGIWAEVQQSYSSGYLVSDVQPTRTSPWWATNVRVGWDGRVGQVQVAPFLGINNAFNHLYVSSVVINAARDRFYEPAPGRNAYLGLSVGAGR